MATTPYRRTTLLVGRAVKRPHRILADDSYWNVPFLQRFLDRIDDEAVHRPGPALEMAQPMITLADQRIGVRGRDGSYSSQEEKRSFQVRARFVTASVARRVGEFERASQLYATAYSLAEIGIDSPTLTELHCRYGWLLFIRNDPDAVKKAQAALDRCGGSTQIEMLLRAEALVLRGAAKHTMLETGDGFVDLAEAVRLVVDKRKSRRGRRVLIAALHGLGKILSESSASMIAQERAYRHLERAKSLMGRQPKSIAKMQVNWHMGKIAFNLGLTKQGERLVRKARNGLRDLEEFQEYTLASLDLAGMYLLFEDRAAYALLVEETKCYLERISPNQELWEILGTWRSRFPQTPEEIRTARKQISMMRWKEAPPMRCPASGPINRSRR